MTCNKEYNLSNGWNHYCSFINILPGVKNDTLWGVYLGCPCKKHDILYSKEGRISRPVADYLFAKAVYKKYIEAGYRTRGKIITPFIYLGVRLFGWFVHRDGLFPWSSKGVDRYQE